MGVQLFSGPRDPPVVRQLRFVIRLVQCIPRLLAALDAGHVEASQKLGRRRLRDGREAELWLVARAPKAQPGPLLRGAGHTPRADGGRSRRT